MTLILMALLIVSIIVNVYIVTGQQKLRGLVRTGLRKAELDNCDRVRLPYNQVAEIMGWTPEFNEHGDEILRELGFEMDRILELKAAGAVA